MKFYVPEIGDELVLTENWEFPLYAESRNVDVGALLGHYLHGGWVDEKELPRLRKPDYKIVYPKREDYAINKSLPMWSNGNFDQFTYNLANQAAVNSNEKYQDYLADQNEFNSKVTSLRKGTLDVTMPKGTVLVVDRIYIRKGSSGFSSITFRAKNLGEATVRGAYSTTEKKKKVLRFWAKLPDCNKMEFEKQEKKEK